MKPSDVRLTVRRLDAAEAEVWVTAPGPISGRFLGPRCRFASTVEVAHYLRPLTPGVSAPSGTQRVILPEPSLWEPATPFVYTALLQAGDEKVTLSYGLHRMELTPAGLRLNRKPFAIRGVMAGARPDFAALRQAGVNTLVAPVGEQTSPLWDEADSWGMFMLGIVSRDERSAGLLGTLRSHPSSLAWLFEGKTEPGASAEPIRGLLLRDPVEAIPPWPQFIAGSPEALARVPATVPTLPIGKSSNGNGSATTDLGFIME